MIGGVVDHVHILASQSRSVAIADWVRDLKSNSTTWIKQGSPALGHFAWQSGYGAFSVEKSSLDRVLPYIGGQEEHHRERTCPTLRVLNSELGVD
jgi:REP element-mobilizing transposase RayT